MKIRFFALLAALVATPASAATYVGRLNGVFTDAALSYWFFLPGMGTPDGAQPLSLNGSKFTLDFIIQEQFNYVTPLCPGCIYPQFVTASVDFKMDPFPPLVPGGFLTTSNELEVAWATDYMYSYGLFSGDETLGSMNFGASPGGGSAGQRLHAVLSWQTDGTGNIVGGGHLGSEHQCCEYDSGFGGSVLIKSGTISVFGVPEPSTWALLILGFGAIGGAMRQRSRHSGYGAVV